MDEFELLIGIVVGLFKLVSWIFKTIFRVLRGIAGIGRRAFRPAAGDRAAPPRLLRNAPTRAPRSQPRAQPAARPQPRVAPVPRLEPRLAFAHIAAHPSPPPPDAYAAPPARSQLRAADDDWLSPRVVREALVLGVLLGRHRGR